MKKLNVKLLVVAMVFILNGCVSSEKNDYNTQSQNIEKNIKNEQIYYYETVADNLDVDAWANIIATDINSYNTQLNTATQYMGIDSDFAYEEYHKGTNYLIDVANVLHKYPSFYNIVLLEDVDEFYRQVELADASFKELMDGINNVSNTKLNELKKIMKIT